MLTRRTNLLLSEIDYLFLTQQADKKGKTMGELIRQAIRKTYEIGKTGTTVVRTLKCIDKLAKNANTKDINYKKLINYGRKY